jgi:hypothetical protein
MSCSTQEDRFRDRLLQVLTGLGIRFPSLFRTADFWRQTVISYDPTAYADDQTQVWVRLGEQVPVFFYEKMERFYQAETGIINERVTYLFATELLDLVSGDHVIVSGISYLIVNIDKQAGVVQLKISPEKSNFVMPDRNMDGSYRTYRLFSARARIA